jgi:adenine-specific DNA-methyltransferase
LIGYDYFEGRMFVEQEERERVNVFDWKAEFPQVFARSEGGFDAVFGNPPYLRIQGLQENYRNQIEYFVTKYQSAVKRFDLYLLFIELAFQLLRTGGRLGFICPHKFINSDFGSGLRDFLIQNLALETFISLEIISYLNRLPLIPDFYFCRNRPPKVLDTLSLRTCQAITCHQCLPTL